MSLAFPNTVLNTIVAEAVDALADEVEEHTKGGAAIEEAIIAVVRRAYGAHKRIVFDGDNYSEAWHQEAERRGLSNLSTTPDALPWLVEHQTVQAFEAYGVLNERELEARFEVLAEQYATKLNIEAETAASIARTMILPAAVRYLAELQAAGRRPDRRGRGAARRARRRARRARGPPTPTPGDLGSLEHAKWMRDTVIPAMDGVRAVADQLERIVADDLWPLPKYSEMLFIK